MNNLFNIKFLDFLESQNYTLGVFAGQVSVPNYHICKKNDKMFSRFFYVLQGEIVFNEGTNHVISATAGSIVYLPNNITYHSEWLPPQQGKYIAFNFILDELNFQLPDHICIAAIDKNGVFLEMFQKAYEIWKTGAPGCRLELLSELYKIMHHLFLSSVRSELKSKHQTIYRGILYIENHYLEEISVEDLAKMCSVSPSSFRRLFKEYKKMSPITYRNYLRIKRARELLMTREYNVTEAAAAVNLPDLCYFCRLFKRFLGYTPKSLFIFLFLFFFSL